jgi:hypothetical protein
MPAAKPRCAKVILFRAKPGRSADYEAYLRAAVEPIDHAAIDAGAMLDTHTLINRDDASQPWTHMRIFFFESEAQREAIKPVFARIAAEQQPDEAKRKARKSQGESMRTLVAELDVGMLG